MTRASWTLDMLPFIGGTQIYNRKLQMLLQSLTPKNLLNQGDPCPILRWVFCGDEPLGGLPCKKEIRQQRHIFLERFGFSCRLKHMIEVASCQ
jgi:hypothetical protein